MLSMKHILAVIPAEAGGRAARLCNPFGSAAQVTVVETSDEDKAALNRAHVILTGLGPVTANHIAAAPALELIQCASHGFDYVALAAAQNPANEL